MNNITIRKLNTGEIPPLSLLLLADPCTKAIDDYIKRGDCFLAIINDITIGCYVLIHTRPFTVELVTVSMMESYQRKGIGKMLVLDSIHRAKEMGIKTIEVGTGNSSLDQLALYQKCGFRLTSIDRDFFKIHYTEDIFENGIQCIDMIRLNYNL